MNELIENIQRKNNWIYFFLLILECGYLFIAFYGIKKYLRENRKFTVAIILVVIVFPMLVVIFLSAASWYTSINSLKGVRYYDAGDYDNAIIHLLKAYRVANSLLDAEIFDKVLFKNSVKLSESIALVYRKANRYEDSIVFFEKRMEKKKGYFQAIVYLSELYYKMDDIEKSLFYHEKVLEYIINDEDKDFFYFYNVGNSNYFLGNYNDALRNFKMAFDLSPKYPILAVKIILSLCSLGKEDEVPKYKQYIDKKSAKSLREILTQKQSSCLSFF